MDVHDVFTPNGYPEHTYVEREHGEYESKLKFQLQSPPAIVSLSGPSRSGKTMLLNNVLDSLEYNSVIVHGGNIDSVASLWNRTLNALGEPVSKEKVERSQDESTIEGKAGLGVPGVDVGGGGSKRSQESVAETSLTNRTGLQQICEIVDLDEFVLYIDDAHYVEKDIHDDISESIKEAHERGLSICVAFIPYRSDDLTRANPDLSGRIQSISLDYWDINDLKKIGEKGFTNLNRYPSELVLNNLARESVGSPHLMQSLCLEMCREMDVHEPSDEMAPLDADPSNVKNALRSIAENISHDYSTVFELLSGNVSEGSNDRKKYSYKLTGKGDIYDVILRALAQNPPKLRFERAELISRVNDVCLDETPHSGNLIRTIRRIDRWISEKVPQQEYCFKWIEDSRRLEMPEPNLTFCIRWSSVNESYPKLH